jgi:hypothetical protein
MPVFPRADGLFGLINSVGIQFAPVGFIPHHLPFRHSNTDARYFRHAISLDERRAKFEGQPLASTARKRSTRLRCRGQISVILTITAAIITTVMLKKKTMGQR